MEKELMEQKAETMEDATIEDTTVEDETVDFMKVILSKPYVFEGETISEIDLNKLENLTGSDMVAINRMMKRRGNTDASPEMTLEFAFFAAMQATHIPLEFFYSLSMKDSMKIKTRVNYFLMY